ncbi:glycosyltransferase family 2 protein [candidate division KSB1 bacterium]|nr:glycosyltransferase family 2 protein [candidate division KSB1 bacterium]
MTQSPKISVVIPLYQEGNHLKETIEVIRNVLESIAEDYEMILVDDGSTDNTWSILEKEAGSAVNIKAIKLSRNFGKESAVSAGLDAAEGDAAIIMDGDLQHPPEVIPELIDKWQSTNANIIEGIKADRGDEPVIKKIGSRIFNSFMGRFTGFDLSGASDFKLIDRSVLEAWHKLPEKSVFFRGMIAWLGFRRERVFYDVALRKHGKTKWTLLKLVKLAISAVTSFTSFPLHFITILGFLFFVFAVGLGIQTLYNKFTGMAVSGFTTVILLQLIIGSLLMIGIGLIGEYISKIYDEIKNRPRYIIEKTVD